MLGGVTFGLFEPIDWLGSTSTALPAVMLMSIWQAVGFHMIIWLTGLQTIPGELYEAADIDGVSKWQQFRFVTWPGLRHTAVFILITITIAAFGLFTQIDVMTQGGPGTRRRPWCSRRSTTGSAGRTSPTDRRSRSCSSSWSSSSP